MIRGARFALLDKIEGDEDGEQDEEGWKGEFRGKEYGNLKTAEKIAWLRKEEVKIKGL